MSRVFISYRRSDTRWAAGRIYDRLAEALGRDNVFFDVSSIEPGEDFVARIEEIVGHCDVLLSIIGPEWISTHDNSGRRRLDGANDLVRVEIRAALDRKIRVIPILLDGAPMPQPEELPADLAPLARRNAHELSFARFQDDLESFVRVLERILAGPAPSPTPAAQPRRAHEPPRTPQPAAAAPIATELPFTIALETMGGVATPLIPHGSVLPAEASSVFSTAADNQTAVEVTLSAGERLVSKENARIGAFQLAGIHAGKKGVPQIEVKAHVDNALILTVTAEDLATRRKEILDAVDLTRLQIPPDALIRDLQPPAQDFPAPSETGATVTAAHEPADAALKILWGSLFPRKRAAGTVHAAGDLRYDLTISFDESFSGTEAQVNVNGRQLKVKIPPGVENGNRIRLKGEAEPGRPPGAGDIYLFLTVSPHPEFERQGKDIYFRVTLDAAQSRREFTLDLPRLGHRAPLKVTVPPSLASGTRLRIAGQGFPDPAGISAPGDLFVVIETEQYQTGGGAA